MKLTTHLLLVLRSMRGAIPPFPQYAFMTWCSFKSTGTSVCDRRRNKRTTCTLIVITADRRQVDTLRYVIAVTDIPSLTTNKVIMFYAGISALGKKSS
jgi:hypothetical protein